MKTFLTLSFVLFVVALHAHGFKKSLTFLTHTGKALRFLLGEVPDSILLENSRSRDSFTLASEVESLFPLAMHKRNRTSKNLKYISKTIEAFEAQGAKVIFIPVPSKLSVYRERYPLDLKPWWPLANEKDENAEVFYQTVLSASKGRGHNLLKVYREQKSAIALYAPNDHHWTSFAILHATKQILLKLQEEGELVPLTKMKETGEHTKIRHGVYTSFYLPKIFFSWFHSLHWKEPLYDLVPLSDPPPSSGRVLVLGTSFSHPKKWKTCGMGDLLGKILHREVINLSTDGGGLWGALVKLKDSNLAVQKGDLVLWEFPVTNILHADPSERESLPNSIAHLSF